MSGQVKTSNSDSPFLAGNFAAHRDLTKFQGPRHVGAGKDREARAKQIISETEAEFQKPAN